MNTHRIQQIEDHVQAVMAGARGPDLKLAHNFKHVNRVRHWALRIAENEGFEDLALVEATALLHDIGLAYVEERSQHAQVGAEIAAQFLHQQRLFLAQEIALIAGAIRCHSSLSGGGRLGEILRDADMLDLFGAVGLMRAFTSKYAKPEYDPYNIKGETWDMTADDFTQRFATGVGVGLHIVDQINFQCSCYQNLQTQTAKAFARPLVEFMRAYLIQLESEIDTAEG